MILIVILTMGVQPQSASALQTVKKSYPLSQGVQYNQYTNNNPNLNSINHLAIDVENANTEVQLGMPRIANGKESTTANATRHSIPGNQVVGAINASFYDMTAGFPLFLLAKDNHILNGGTVSKGADQYMNIPTAFGMTADGRGIIDNFDFNVTLSHKAKNYRMSGLNHARNAGDAVIYTPQFHSKTTNTNEFGYEIVVDTGKAITENTFGQTLTGRVTQIIPSGSKAKLTIPTTGFVVSLHGGDRISSLSHVGLGDEVSVNFAIDNRWKDSQFILASGPYLVKDGKPYLMMSTTSSRAKEIAPRTVVGTSKDGKIVHFITIDGRQSHSKGMNMMQLANYLVSLGIDKAINLDGGGSTTMGIRNPGSTSVTLANLPSNTGNAQRLVSATLLAVNTAPAGIPTSIKFTSSTNYVPLLAGASSSINVQQVLDGSNNKLPTDGRVSLTSELGTLNINGLSFTTTKAGNDRIFINYDGQQLQSLPIRVVDSPTTMSVSPSVNTLNAGEKIKFTVDAKAANAEKLAYETSQLKWSIEGDIGTITTSGEFTAKNPGATGKIIATLGTKSVATAVTIKESPLFTDIPNDYTYFKEIQYLTKDNIITGDLDGSFNPNNHLTRVHAALIISRALDLDTSHVINPNFKDVSTTHRYYKEVAAVVQAGIMDGKGNELFDPEATLTRGQMAKVVALSYDLKGQTSKTFLDVPNDYGSRVYILLLAANNITTGYEGNLYKPFIPISRAHFSVFLYRAMNLK